MKALKILFISLIAIMICQIGAYAERYADNLTRGTSAVRSANGILVTWRLLGYEEYDTSFAVYRDGVKIAETDKTNYLDEDGNLDCGYQVAPIYNGAEGDKSEWAVPFPSGDTYFDLPIQKPDPVLVPDINGGDPVSTEYTSYDATCGDVDGDGNYEIILMWAAGAVDNSQPGYTGNVIIDAYKLDGTLLWRIDLGKNIRSGAHYTQMIAGDFNNDGKCELALKTAPGSKDGNGNYVSEASEDIEIQNTDNEKDYRDSQGRILSGPEYFTVFSGEDGSAIDTIEYPILRGDDINIWGDNYGNRVDRFLGCAAYLDGESQSIVTWRGYYTRMAAVAYDLKDGRLVERCRFDTNDYGDEYEHQGNHNIIAADVDNDGKDEVISGAICLDDDFSIRWCSFRAHGDALHIGWFDKDSKIPVYFSVHEEVGSSKPDGTVLDGGMTVYNASTGEELFHAASGADTPRGMMGNFGMGGNYQFWSIGAGSYIHNDEGFVKSEIAGSSSFRLFWDGDIYDELLDGKNENGYAVLSKYSIVNNTFYDLLTTQYTGGKVINGTKKTPMLQADLIGDWREEFILKLYGDKALRVYSTNIYTDNKLYTLMHDSTYRTGVAAETIGYNQPPHIGYYLSEDGNDSRSEKPKIKFAAELPKNNIPEESPHKIYEPDENKILDFEGSLPSTNEAIVNNSLTSAEYGAVKWSYSGGPYGYLTSANLYHASVRPLADIEEKDGNFLAFASNAKSKSAFITAQNTEKGITDKGTLSFDISYPVTFSTNGADAKGNSDVIISVGDGTTNAFQIMFKKSEYALYINYDATKEDNVPFYKFSSAEDAQRWHKMNIDIDRTNSKATISILDEASNTVSSTIDTPETEPINTFSVKVSSNYGFVLLDNLEMYETPNIDASLSKDLKLTLTNKGAKISAKIIAAAYSGDSISNVKIYDCEVENGTTSHDISNVLTDTADKVNVYVWNDTELLKPICLKQSLTIE